MLLGRDLEYRGSHLKLRSQWKVLTTEVKIDVKLITRERPALPRPREQCDHACIHQRNLASGVTVVVQPSIADEASAGVKLRFG